MNSIETKRIVYIWNPNESNQHMVTMNATDDYNCHVLALCPPLRMNAHTSACTHTDWLNWTLVDRRSVNAMRCDAMRWECDAMRYAMRCDVMGWLSSVWPYTSLNSIGYVCTSYGGCWMTPTSVVWLFWHTQEVSVVVISVSVCAQVCAQAVIAAAYMQQPSTSLLRAYANEWVNERKIERTNDRRYQRTNQPTNKPTNQRTNKLTNQPMKERINSWTHFSRTSNWVKS